MRLRHQGPVFEIILRSIQAYRIILGRQ